MSSDIDYQLACILQAEINEEESKNHQNISSPQSLYSSSEDDTATRNGGDKPLSLVDERWEMLDPTPDVRAMFIEFDNTFFKGRLAGVEVKWSPRMTLCAGVCSYEGRGGLCSIRLSTPLLKLRPRKDLVETLLHEMIHAYLFVTQNNRDRDGHGPEFCKHMNRINKEAGTKISIYHNFQDEVDLYRQHIWRCDGPCRTRKPFFGYVKRAMNRAPSPRDPWWSSHQQSCGGTYHKEKEPEGYGEKKGKRKREDVDSNASKKSKSRDISSVPALEGERKLVNGASNLKVHPTLQEIWAKKQHTQHNDNNHTVTSLSDKSNDSKSSSSGEEERGTIRNGSLRKPSNVHGVSRNVPTSSAGKYKPSNGSRSEGGNIHGFSGKVAAPTFHNFFKNPHGPTASSSKYEHGGDDIKENNFDKSRIGKGGNDRAKVGSNIYGLSGQVAAPTFHNFFKNPHAPTTSSGKYENDGNNKEFNNYKNWKSSCNDITFPGIGQVLGGKPKPTEESGPKSVKKDDRPRTHVAVNGNDDGWLSKKNTSEDQPNKVINRNDKHIKKSRKIVKLMEIVGSDSESDSDDRMSVGQKSQSNFKSTEAKYISYNDEDEEAYNNKIYSQMQESEDLEYDVDINISKVSKKNHEKHNPSTKSSNSQTRTTDDEKQVGAFNASKTSKMPDAAKSPSGQLNVKGVMGMMVNCPVCGTSVNESSINQHIDECLNYGFLNQ